MQFCRYKAVHVWACPPPNGDDYLFYRHPENQRSPNHDILEEWYNKLMRRGIMEGLILDNLVGTKVMKRPPKWKIQMINF